MKRKMVPIEEAATEFGLRSSEVVDRIQVGGGVGVSASSGACCALVAMLQVAADNKKNWPLHASCKLVAVCILWLNPAPASLHKPLELLPGWPVTLVQPVCCVLLCAGTGGNGAYQWGYG